MSGIALGRQHHLSYLASAHRSSAVSCLTMTQPTGWSPNPISEESTVCAGSSLVPLPDMKRARQGEAMPVIAATGHSEIGGQSSGSMQDGASSGGESDDVEVEKIQLDINMSRLK